MQARRIEELVLRNVVIRMSWRPRQALLATVDAEFGRCMVAQTVGDLLGGLSVCTAGPRTPLPLPVDDWSPSRGIRVAQSLLVPQLGHMHIHKFRHPTPHRATSLLHRV
jgi:hypothetical protein